MRYNWKVWLEWTQHIPMGVGEFGLEVPEPSLAVESPSTSCPPLHREPACLSAHPWSPVSLGSWLCSLPMSPSRYWISLLAENLLTFLPPKIILACLKGERKWWFEGVTTKQRNRIHRPINPRIHTSASCSRDDYSPSNSSPGTNKKLKNGSGCCLCDCLSRTTVFFFTIGKILALTDTENNTYWL